MKRATPLHLAVDRSQAPPVPLARRLWSYVVHWLRPSSVGPDAATGPGAPVASPSSSAIPDATTHPEPAPKPDPPAPPPAAHVPHPLTPDPPAPPLAAHVPHPPTPDPPAPPPAAHMPHPPTPDAPAPVPGPSPLDVAPAAQPVESALAPVPAPPPPSAPLDAPIDGRIDRPAALAPFPEAGDAGLDTCTAIAETTARIAGHPLRATPLITVVAIAPGWSARLARSVSSVLRQSYSSWELVIVDTSAPPQPPPLVADGDGRIRVLGAAGRTDDAARGRGLEAAQGQLLTWLTPGAVMAPGWLRGLAWAAGEWPGTDLFSGTALTFAGEVPDQSPEDLVALCRDGRVSVTMAGQEDDLMLLARRRQPTHASASANRAARWEEGDRQPIPVVATVSGGRVSGGPES